MGLVERIDWAVMYWLNQFVGLSPAFDAAVRLGTEWNFFRSAWLVCVLWWAWFAFKSDDDRLKLLAGMAGVLIATGLSRAMQMLMFVHIRPFNQAAEMGLMLPANLDTHWGLRSSFPSDTATLYFAVAALIFTMVRGWGWLAYAWVAVIIALPRVYLTYHHMSDVIGGAMLGIGCVYLAQAFRHAPLGFRPLMNMSTTAPQYFYPLVFIGLYQITDSFAAVETSLHGVSRLVHLMKGA